MSIGTSTLAVIHTLKNKAKLDDDTYRDLLQRETGKRSARDLNRSQAERFIGVLRDLTGPAGPRGAVSGLDGPIGAKLRALWIAGYDLGLIRDRTDRAMLSFLERQTRVSHVNFLAEPGMGNRAIEGLKSWLAREGKFAWPADPRDVIGSKRAVIDAQWKRLYDLGDVKPFMPTDPMGDLPFYAYRVAGKNGWHFFEPRDYDAVQNALGRRMRAVLASKAAKRECA